MSVFIACTIQIWGVRKASRDGRELSDSTHENEKADGPIPSLHTPTLLFFNAFSEGCSGRVKQGKLNSKCPEILRMGKIGHSSWWTPSSTVPMGSNTQAGVVNWAHSHMCCIQLWAPVSHEHRCSMLGQGAHWHLPHWHRFWLTQNVVFFYFPCTLDLCKSVLVSSLLSRFSGIVVCRLLFFALCIKTIYESVHVVIFFLCLDYLTQNDVF